MQFRAARLTVFATMVVWSSALAHADTPKLQHATFFGGAGDEDVAGVALLSDGGFVVSGFASPGLGGGAARDLAGGGPGFVARFGADAKPSWVARLPERARAVRVDARDRVYVAGGRHAYLLAASGSEVVATSPDLPGDATDLALAGATVGVVAGGWAVALGADDLAERFRVEVKRSRVSSVAVDAQGGLYVGGDNNTNTGFEPYRSPFVLHVGPRGGAFDAKLYDWSGPAVRDGIQLQADSRIDGLTIDAKGQLWFAGGSDGGNTVLAKPARDLKAAAQPALDGACYASPCFNYKGAKHTGMFARVNAAFDDIERGTWYVPYTNPQMGSTVSAVTTPCGCKGPPLSPNSLTVGGIAFPNDVVAVTGNAGGSIPETADAWFPGTDGSAYLALFDRDLKSVSFSSFIPGTAGGITTNQPRVDARGGRIVIAGNATKDFRATQGAYQPSYGGGDRDGFVIVACVGAAGCDGPVPPIAPPAEAPPSAGASAGSAGAPQAGRGGSAGATATAASAGAAGSAVERAPERSAGGCAIARTRASTTTALAGLCLFLAAGRRRRRRR